jgi:hypothetical protein
MEELLSTETKITEKSVRTAARVLSIVLIGYIYYLWSSSFRIPLSDSFSDLNWRQITLLLLDLVVVAGCVVSWKREQLGAWITFVSAAVVQMGSSILHESGFMHTSATELLGLTTPALFLFSWYKGLNAAQEGKRKSLAREIRWMARAYSIILIIFSLIFPVTGFSYSPFRSLIIPLMYAVIIVAAIGILIVWKYERTGSFVILIGTLYLYIGGTYLKASLIHTPLATSNFLSSNILFLICGGLFYFSSYLHKEKSIAPAEPEPEAKRTARAAKDLTLGRAFGGLMILLLTDHIWIDAGNIFKNDVSIGGNLMMLLLYCGAAAGVALSLYRGFWGVRILLVALAIRLAWFIPHGASDGATLFIGLIVGSLAVFYLLRAEDAMPGLTLEENKESHAADVRLLANALSGSAAVYFIVRYILSMYSTDKYIFNAALSGYPWVPFAACIVTVLIALYNELNGGLALIVSALVLMAVGDTLRGAYDDFVVGFTFLAAGVGYVVSFFMHECLPAPAIEDTGEEATEMQT